MYVYSTDSTHEIKVKDMNLTVALGITFLVMAVLDSLFFRPSMTYIELMASPCFYPATHNTRINLRTGENRRCRSVYEAYLITALSVMPFAGSFGNSLDIQGIPLMFLINGMHESDQKEHYKSASRELIQRLETMYADVSSVDNPLQAC